MKKRLFFFLFFTAVQSTYISRGQSQVPSSLTTLLPRYLAAVSQQLQITSCSTDRVTEAVGLDSTGLDSCRQRIDLESSPNQKKKKLGVKSALGGNQLCFATEDLPYIPSFSVGVIANRIIFFVVLDLHHNHPVHQRRRTTDTHSHTRTLLARPICRYLTATTHHFFVFFFYLHYHTLHEHYMHSTCPTLTSWF